MFHLVDEVEFVEAMRRYLHQHDRYEVPWFEERCEFGDLPQWSEVSRSTSTGAGELRGCLLTHCGRITTHVNHSPGADLS